LKSNSLLTSSDLDMVMIGPGEDGGESSGKRVGHWVGAK
jgi:hypothetical protein